MNATDADRVVSVYGNGEKRFAELRRFDVYWDPERQRWTVFWGDE